MELRITVPAYMTYKHFGEDKNGNEGTIWGIDTHKENFAGCIVDEKGRVLREHTFPATKEAV